MGENADANRVFEELRDAKRSRRPVEQLVGSWILVVIGSTVLVWLLFFSITAVVHALSTRGENLPDLVTEVQKDIDKIDANSKTWKVDEAEVEVNFSLKNTESGGKELKAVSGEMGTERETAHRLMLTLRKVQPKGADVSGTVDTISSAPGTKYKSKE